jgi:Fe-S-cluster containining protein
MPRKGTQKKIKQDQKKQDKKQNKGKKKTEPKTKSDTGQEKRPPKFKFECQLCGKCCKNETINITLLDIDKWMADNTIYRVFHLLRFEENADNIQIFLIKDDDGYCNLFHRDNNKCTIYNERPLFCRAYPLGFDGENYLVRTKDCIGLNKGEMTKEKLETMRNFAFDEYIAKRQTDRVLPTVQRIIINTILERSQAFMEKLADAEAPEGETAKNNEETEEAGK